MKRDVLSFIHLQSPGEDSSEKSRSAWHCRPARVYSRCVLQMSKQDSEETWNAWACRPARESSSCAPTCLLSNCYSSLVTALRQSCLDLGLRLRSLCHEKHHPSSFPHGNRSDNLKNPGREVTMGYSAHTHVCVCVCVCVYTCTNFTQLQVCTPT